MQDNPDNTGKGIGLTLSKRIIERLGGEITLSSQVNVGTKVSFYIKSSDVYVRWVELNSGDAIEDEIRAEEQKDIDMRL